MGDVWICERSETVYCRRLKVQEYKINYFTDLFNAVVQKLLFYLFIQCSSAKSFILLTYSMQ